ncbi:hypothetical protein Sango_1481200 [Sesamum angolense]|uniref:Uncharacterized protein n=1 Tax=Sesamum angolense TaxID=2727404 RepID=A0AAE1WN80_9LAMI|nr:hypothetical protein Sango_1481200 [Sesamum angolense]
MHAIVIAIFMSSNLPCKVLALRAILKDQVAKKQVSTGYTEVISGEETVESTSIPSSDNTPGPQDNNVPHHQIAECNYVFNVEDYNQVMMTPTPYNWPPLPSCP